MGFWKSIKEIFNPPSQAQIEINNDNLFIEEESNLFESETNDFLKIDEHYDEFMEQIWDED